MNFDRPGDDARLVRLETQVERVLSDIESEKGTRTRVNVEITKRFDDLEKRVRIVERNIWLASGAITVVVFVANFLFRHA